MSQSPEEKAALENAQADARFWEGYAAMYKEQRDLARTERDTAWHRAEESWHNAHETHKSLRQARDRIAVLENRLIQAGLDPK